MPQKCCIPSCRNRYKGGKGVSMFELPARPETLRNQWVKNLCIALGATPANPPEWMYKDHTRVCFRHFEKNAINKSGVKTRLIPGSVPSIFEEVGALANTVKKKIIKKVDQPLENKSKPKNHDNNFTTQSLLYEPAVILHENTMTGSQRKDAAVQVDVIDKTRPTPECQRIQKLLRLEKKKYRALEEEIKNLKNKLKEPTPKSLFQKKLFAIVAASERGDQRAQILLGQIKQFECNTGNK